MNGADSIVKIYEKEIMVVAVTYEAFTAFTAEFESGLNE